MFLQVHPSTSCSYDISLNFVRSGMYRRAQLFLKLVNSCASLAVGKKPTVGDAFAILCEGHVHSQQAAFVDLNVFG